MASEFISKNPATISISGRLKLTPPQVENQKVSFTMMKIHFSLQLENAQLYDLSAVKEIACSG